MLKQEIELYIIGNILSKNSNYDSVAGFLKPEHFTENFKNLYAQMIGLLNDGKVADALTLRPFVDKETFKSLLKLSGDYFGAPIKDHAQMLVSMWQKEQLLNLFLDYEHQIQNGIILEEIEETLPQKIDHIFAKNSENNLSTGAAFDVVLQQIETAYNNKGKVSGISSGITLLDRKLGGFRGDELTVIAGRSGMGKTSFALNLAVAALKQKKSVCFFSLEMSKEQLLQRLVCMTAGVEPELVRNGEISPKQLEDIIKAKEYNKREYERILNIFDRPAVTVSEIRADCRILKRKKLCDLIIIDHLNLIRPENPRATAVEGLTQITGSLKALTKELKIPVILLCQLNRAVENQEDKRPSLKDLRGSGSIEQDAEQVIFLYRPEYYLMKKAPENKTDGDIAFEDWKDELLKVKNKCHLIIDKNRNGSVGTVDIFMDVSINKIANLENKLYGGCYD